MLNKKLQLISQRLKEASQQIRKLRKDINKYPNEEIEKKKNDIINRCQRDITFMDKSMTLAQKLLDEKDTENE